MSRILVAVSSPWAADKILEPLADLAKRLPAEVLAVHVSRPSGGQMREQELEAVMGRFVRGEVDVLVSTMIVESGLDVPNANTMIVDRADRFGLAQLYQLRGRVGRSHRRAFCYLLVPDHVDTQAEERLQVLEHHTDLGSGYRIALRDLEPYIPWHQLPNDPLLTYRQPFREAEALPLPQEQRATRNELLYWLENMLVDHAYSWEEAARVCGWTVQRIKECVAG